MIGRPAFALFLGLAVAIPSAQRKPPPPSRVDLVEIDVIVRDRDGEFVSDLRAAEFTVKEDGRPMPIQTFAAVNATGSAVGHDARLVALLLDDVGVPMNGTLALQGIAKLLASQATAADEVTVIRLNNRTDEAFGDLDTALDRIDAFRAGIMPYVPVETQQHALKTMAAIAGQLALYEHRRKSLVCIGSPAVCNVEEPSGGSRSQLWPHWVAAIAALSRANVSVYAVSPMTSTRVRLDAGGVVDATGGRTFRNTSNFVRVSNHIWDDAKRYYMIGTGPPRRPAISIPSTSRCRGRTCACRRAGGAATDQSFGFQRKYTGTPSSTMMRPGQVVAVR